MEKMRKAFPLVILALVAAACGGGGGEPQVGFSGDGPQELAVETTTTTVEEATETSATEVVPIPDVSGLGLVWDEPNPADFITGQISTNDFNVFLVDSAPTGITGEEAVAVFLGLVPDEEGTQMLVSDIGLGKKQITVVETAEDDSVRAVRFSFVTEERDRNFAAEAAEDVVQAEDGFEGAADQGAAGDTESVAEEDLSTDEEIAEPESEDEEAPPDPIVQITSALQTTQCQPGRGHQDFIVGFCV